jgi:hypothetical protein
MSNSTHVIKASTENTFQNQHAKTYYGYAILNPNTFYTANVKVFAAVRMCYKFFWHVKLRYRIFGSRRFETAQWSELQRRVVGTTDVNVL